MTKSYLVNEIQQYELSELWEQNIVAQRFSIRNISNQNSYKLIVTTLKTAT